ncbi:hypothetical protein [uncultured Friedmanniella sp.]|uniref:hypothetical protein n=1 Tax=uncultured Friedmanniella sp. TaxID=335381 RepID=UPI0035CAFE10
MINVSVTFDPSSAADLTAARAVLDHFAAQHASEPEAPAALEAPAPDTIHQKVIALLRGNGRRRSALIREVARCSPDWSQRDILAGIVGSSAALLGISASVEKSWRTLGMVGPFFQADDEGNLRMEMSLADIVLFALHEIDEPDPLVAARY